MRNDDINQEDDILIQSFLTIELLAELHNNKFLNSEYFNKLTVQDMNVKTVLPQIGIDNQGFLLITLYVLLVIPKQFLENKFQSDFKALNEFILSIQVASQSTYKDEEKIKNIDFVRHIRNAVAHGRVKFIPEISVTFSDKDFNKKREVKSSCEITIPTNQIGLLISKLQIIFQKYIEQKNKL